MKELPAPVSPHAPAPSPAPATACDTDEKAAPAPAPVTHLSSTLPANFPPLLHLPPSHPSNAQPSHPPLLPRPPPSSMFAQQLRMLGPEGAGKRGAHAADTDAADKAARVPVRAGGNAAIE